MEAVNQKKYVMVCVSVVCGYGDDVVNCARQAGAKGGTTFRGRSHISEQISEHFGVSNQEERDFILMVIPKTIKQDVMKAINASYGLTSDAHGVIIALPVDDVCGIES